jgi:Ca2+-binding EF-hand superfamily protein
MQDQDITLSTLFKLIDTNSDESLTMAEFKQKLKALHTPLDDGEMEFLFKHLDKAAKGSIDYQMFVSEFPEINSKQQPLSI